MTKAPRAVRELVAEAAARQQRETLGRIEGLVTAALTEGPAQWRAALVSIQGEMTPQEDQPPASWRHAIAEAAGTGAPVDLHAVDQVTALQVHAALVAAGRSEEEATADVLAAFASIYGQTSPEPSAVTPTADHPEKENDE